jgi:hypothetical protein
MRWWQRLRLRKRAVISSVFIAITISIGSCMRDEPLKLEVETSKGAEIKLRPIRPVWNNVNYASVACARIVRTLVTRS